MSSDIRKELEALGALGTPSGVAAALDRVQSVPHGTDVSEDLARAITLLEESVRSQLELAKVLGSMMTALRGHHAEDPVASPPPDPEE